MHPSFQDIYLLQCESSRTSVRDRFRVPSLSDESEPEDESATQSETELSFGKATSGLLKQVCAHSYYYYYYFPQSLDRFTPILCTKRKKKYTVCQYTIFFN